MHVNSGITPEETRLVRAEECIERALALDPECGQAIFVRGIVSGLRGRLEEGVSARPSRSADANLLAQRAGSVVTPKFGPVPWLHLNLLAHRGAI
jgi:hypothetical protein